MRNKRGAKVMCHALGVLGFLGFSFIFSFFLAVKEVGLESAWPTSSFSASLHLFFAFFLNYSMPTKPNKIK